VSYFPKYLKEYPNMHSSFPFHISLNHLEHGFPAHRHDFLEFSTSNSGADNNPKNIANIIHYIHSNYQEELSLSYNTFTRIFRDTKGVVPTEYRKKSYNV
jgi:YesN/AraC family two-component response regulator